MELKLEKEEFNEPFKKLLNGLIEGDDLKYFTIDKEINLVTFMLGDWQVELFNDGTWRIG